MGEGRDGGSFAGVGDVSVLASDDDLRRHDAYTVPEYSRVGLGQPWSKFRRAIMM